MSASHRNITTSRTARVVATALAVAAIAPAAQARPLIDEGRGYVQPAAETRTVVVHDSSFSWNDAGLGAVAGVLGLLTAGGLTFTVRQHRQRDQHVAVS
jgi:hypothetical protein